MNMIRIKGTGYWKLTNEQQKEALEKAKAKYETVKEELQDLDDFMLGY